jgi:hypothetical protein
MRFIWGANVSKKKQRPYALNIPDAANGNLIIDNNWSERQC